MFKWVPYTMVRIAAFFIAGILFGIYHPHWIELDTAQVLLLTFFSGYFIHYVFGLKIRTRSPVNGMIGLLTVLVAGYVHILSFTDWLQQGHLSKYIGNVSAYEADVKGLPEEKGNSWKYTVKILRVNDGTSWKDVDAKILLYVKKDPEQQLYFYGDKILVKGRPEYLSPPQNPHEFDFKRFLSFKNIYHQQFARAEGVQLVSPIQTKDFKYYSLLAREWAGNQLKKQLTNPKEQAIALALTLGITDGIDNELQSAYAASGAMHVLAVSGLHVGILYGIILLLFRPFQNLSWSRWVIAIISLLALWSFAFITGLSPSVLRAVTMFSFIAIAKPFGRSTSIYNTLASSAFLLLLVNPYLIMSVGFQLSYLAVLGIVSIHRPLYQLLEPKNALIDWVWNISCVSIAAQLATFSLGLLYFHQFPVYFLASNLFVIPGAITVLITSILVIATSALPPISSLLGLILQKFIQILNFVVFSFEKFPHSIINDIYITTFQCWLLILGIGFILLMLYSKQLNFMIATLIVAITFSVSQWLHYIDEIKTSHLFVYNIPGHHAIEWISDGKSIFFADSALATNEEQMRFHIRPNRLFRRVYEIKTNSINFKTIAFKGKGKVIGIVNGPIHSWPPGLKVDFLIVGNNSFRSLEEIKNTINFDNLIFDSSNSPYVIAKILNEKDNSIFSVSQQGAYIKKF